MLSSTLLPLLVSIQLAQPPVQTGQIVGTVVDQVTGRPLDQAQIQLVGTPRGAATDSVGRFVLARVPVGTYSIRVVRIGYRPAVVTDLLVNGNRPTQAAVELSELASTIGTVQVQAATSTALAPTPSVPTSRITMSYEEIRRSPGALGDVSRLVQAMPGVATGNDTRNQIIARGGSPSENLMLIDGFEMPNINHFSRQGNSGGPISMINNELLREATFVSGGFSSQYGNRLSSVLDIRMREGTRDKTRAEFDLNSAGAAVVVEGGLGSKGSFIGSARQSYLALVAGAFGLPAVPYTTNFQTKLTYEPSTRDRVWFVGVGGYDHIDLESTSEDLENADPEGTINVKGNRWMGGVAWQRLLGRAVGTLRLSGNTTRGDTKAYEPFFGAQPLYVNDNRESEWNARYDVSASVPVIGTLQAGLSYKQLGVRTRYVTPIGLRNPFDAAQPRVNPVNADDTFTGSIIGANLEWSRRVTRWVDLTGSVRADRFALADGTAEGAADGAAGGAADATNAMRVAPRLAAIVHLTPTVQLTGTAGRYYQQVPLVYSSTIAANRSLPPMRADHLVSGLAWTPTDRFKVSVEAYRKWYRDYPVSTQYGQLTLANDAEFEGGAVVVYPMMSGGTGRAQGIEFLMQQKFDGRNYGQLTYTRSETQHRAGDGVLRRGTFDVPHMASLILGHKRGTTWEFSTRLSYASGRPLTPLLDDVSVSQNRLVYDVANYNTLRSPDYARFDVRVDRRWFLRGGTLAMYVELQNLTNRENQQMRIWNAKTKSAQYEDQLAFFPVFGMNWKF